MDVSTKVKFLGRRETVHEFGGKPYSSGHVYVDPFGRLGVRIEGGYSDGGAWFETLGKPALMKIFRASAESLGYELTE